MPDSHSPNPGSDLIRMHNALTRALDVSLQQSQANGPEPASRQGFHSFERALVGTLHSHHLSEDEVAFPSWQKIEPQLPFDQLFIHHRQIAPLLDRLRLWLDAGESAWEPDSLAHLHAVLTALESIWRPHILLEEGYFSPLTFQRMWKPEENARLAEQIGTHSQQHVQSPELVVPFVLYNLSPEDRAQMAQAYPPQVVEQLVPIDWKAAWAPMQPFLLD